MPYIIDNSPFPNDGCIYYCLGGGQRYTIKKYPIESTLIQEILMGVQMEKACDVKESSIADNRQIPLQTFSILDFRIVKVGFQTLWNEQINNKEVKSQIN